MDGLSEKLPLKLGEPLELPEMDGEFENEPDRLGEFEAEPDKDGEFEKDPLKDGDWLRDGEFDGEPDKLEEFEAEPLKLGELDGDPEIDGDWLKLAEPEMDRETLAEGLVERLTDQEAETLPPWITGMIRRVFVLTHSLPLRTHSPLLTIGQSVVLCDLVDGIHRADQLRVERARIVQNLAEPRPAAQVRERAAALVDEETAPVGWIPAFEAHPPLAAGRPGETALAVEAARVVKAQQDVTGCDQVHIQS